MRRVVWFVLWASAVFAAIHVFWGLGYRTGLSTFLAYEGEREASIVASFWFRVLGLWGVALLSMIGVALAGCILRGWDGSVVPRRIPLAFSTATAGILFLRGSYGLLLNPLRLLGLVAMPSDVDSDWFWLDALLLAPGFLLVGAGFAVIAWDQWQHIRRENASRDR